jgi:hypothetical protein
MWRDRGDLEIMKSMGANTVRLYGNHAEKDHTAFLDESSRLGLQVIAGMSDYPYTQSPDNCQLHHSLNCYENVKSAYKQNLEHGGFIDKVTKKYHPALRNFILINEPDAKLAPNNPRLYQKGLISAFDGVLDAEKEMGVEDDSPFFTVTFTYAICSNCGAYTNKPAMGQMYDFLHAVQNPGDYDYTPKNDLYAAYRTRFANSMNTFNPAPTIRDQFMDPYEETFRELGIHIFIGEYHNAPLITAFSQTQEEDIKKILAIAAEPNSLLDGISFFEFQLRYDKGGTELEYGVFGLGNTGTDFTFGFKTFTAYCLTKVTDRISGEVEHEAVTRAFGGPGVDPSKLCAGEMVV